MKKKRSLNLIILSENNMIRLYFILIWEQGGMATCEAADYVYVCL